MRQSMRGGLCSFAGYRGPRRPATCMGPGGDRIHCRIGNGSERAPIKDADVTVTDVERGIVRSAKTNDAGAYNVTRLPPGSYQLKVSAPASRPALIRPSRWYSTRLPASMCK